MLALIKTTFHRKVVMSFIYSNLYFESCLYVCGCVCTWLGTNFPPRISVQEVFHSLIIVNLVGRKTRLEPLNLHQTGVIVVMLPDDCRMVGCGYTRLMSLHWSCVRTEDRTPLQPQDVAH